MNIVLFEQQEIREDCSVSLADVRAKHVTEVLGAGVGSEVRIGVVEGPLGVGTVTQVGDGQVTLHCALEAAAPKRPRVDLLLALPRPKVLRRLWAQLAAIGVGRVLLTNSGKVERDYFDSHYVRPEGFRPYLIEGLQQARDTRVPEVSVHKQFRKLVEDEIEALSPGTRRLVAHPGAATSVRQALAEGTADRVLVAVGPEGGWNDFERNLLASRGFVEVGLGQRPLTTTTACIALLTLVHDAIR
jgi:RsmE family RNA methyltransferase